jgi:hypothetical protein
MQHALTASPKRAAEQALGGRLASLGVALDGDSRVEHLRDAVVESVDDASLGQVLADLRAGSGGELTAGATRRPKFHSAYSSSALAVNAFGRWRLAPAALALGGARAFSTLRFEAQRPIFTSRATPPNLDVLLEADDRVVAVESKLTEHLAGHERARFADRYDVAVAELAAPAWREAYALLRREPERFAFLNAAQIVKHYLGLKQAQRADPRPVTLTYLFWEPTNAAEISACERHRRELDELEALVDDPLVTFEALSYPQLWDAWDADDALDGHVERLRERYAVSL